MSTVATVQPAAEGAAVGAPRPLLDRTTLAMAALLGGAYLILFHEWFRRQVLYAWEHTQDWGHTVMVPLIALYLLHQRREEIMRARPVVFWPGLSAVLFALVAYVFFAVGVPNHLGQGLAVILALFGVTLVLGGPEVLRIAFLPIAYLVFMITLPEKIMIMLTFPLQRIAAEGSWALLNIFGISTEISGVVITIYPEGGKPVPLNVAEQCSGMRTLISFVALAGAVALVATRHWWQRVAVLIFSVPVAIGVNVGRVALLGVLSLVNPSLASGSAHTFIGTLWLIPGFFLFLLIVWVLNRLIREDEAAAQGASA